jgi:polysaccharide biosynthesis protein PelD
MMQSSGAGDRGMTGETKRTADTGSLPVLPPRFALVELFIFGAIILAEFQVAAFPNLTTLNPHPYWIAVLLLSLQYGTVSGLLAAILAIGGTLLIGMPEAEIGESYFNYLVRVWTQPVLWIVVALLLGSFRMRQIEERDALQRQVDDSTARSAALSGYSRQLKSRVEGLERQISVASTPETTRLLNALSTLSAAKERTAALEAAKSVLSLAFPNARLSVFAVEGGGLAHVFAQNWAEGARWRTRIRPEDPLAIAIVSEARTLSLLRAGDEAILAGEGLYAVPIQMPGNAAVVGMLKVEDTQSVEIDAQFAQRLSLVARHLASVAVDGVVAVNVVQSAAPAASSVVPWLRRLRVGERQSTSNGASMATTRPPIEPAS